MVHKAGLFHSAADPESHDDRPGALHGSVLSSDGGVDGACVFCALLLLLLRCLLSAAVGCRFGGVFADEAAGQPAFAAL